MTFSDCRVFQCDRCHELVRICRRCDHGNRFCPPCASLGRAEKQRAAGKRYQKTEKGRLNHKVRQENYRDRLPKKVTHQGDLVNADKRESKTANKRGREIHNERQHRPQQPSSIPGHCHFCGRPCKGHERTGPLSKHPHANRRAPRIPHYEKGRLC